MVRPAFSLLDRSPVCLPHIVNPSSDLIFSCFDFISALLHFGRKFGLLFSLFELNVEILQRSDCFFCCFGVCFHAQPLRLEIKVIDYFID